MMVIKNGKSSRKELFPVDGERIRQALWEQGYHSHSDQAARLGTNEKRLREVFRGGRFQMATILRWCEKAAIDVREVVPDSAVVGRMGERNGEPRRVGDWQVGGEISRWIEATNGLQYRIHRLTHRHLGDGRLARGKLYDMAGFSDADRAALKGHLRRHQEVCHRIGSHPNIALNLTALPDLNGQNWWVIDSWIEGKSLKELLLDGDTPPIDLPRLMRGIADGLAAMHAHGIVRRELSPKFVVLRNSDLTPVLTDFELAKLLEGAPTVAARGDWESVDDPYRAPEVSASSPDTGPEVDVYSWGRILVRTVAGILPDPGNEASALDRCRLPKGIRDLASVCVSVDRSKRPKSMEEVLRAIKGWK